MNEKSAGVPVVVTTERGVFFGYATPPCEPVNGRIHITQARMCVSWSADVRGVIGLAAKGPTASCRISPAAPAVLVEAVTAVMTCTAEAAKAWESAPWAK